MLLAPNIRGSQYLVLPVLLAYYLLCIAALLRRVFIFGSYSEGYNGFGSAILD